MTDYIASGTDLTSVANAIRTKGGTSASLAFPNGFVSAINDISGGGIPGAYTVSLSVDGTVVSAVSVPEGKSMSNAYSPIKSGFVFTGWSTTSGAVIPNIDFPYTPSRDTTLYAVFNTVAQYKASPTGYGNQTPNTVAFSSNANLLNWTPEQVTINGNVFLKFPTFYRKVVAVSSNQLTSFIISSWKEDNDFVPYSVFVDESGNILPYVLIGKYCSKSAVGSNLNSVASGSAVGRAIGEARAKAIAVGTGYQQWDWQFQKLWQDLICAKMQTININTGSGIDEDVFGLVWGQTATWVDGVCAPLSGTKWVFSYKPSQYTDQPSASTVGYNEANYIFPTGSGQEIKKLGYDSSHPFFNYPTELYNDSNYSTYYCDAYYYSSGLARPVYSNVGIAAAYNGAFLCAANSAWSLTLGVRLCYRPLSA